MYSSWTAPAQCHLAGRILSRTFQFWISFLPHCCTRFVKFTNSTAANIDLFTVCAGYEYVSLSSGVMFSNLEPVFMQPRVPPGLVVHFYHCSRYRVRDSIRFTVWCYKSTCATSVVTVSWLHSHQRCDETLFLSGEWRWNLFDKQVVDTSISSLKICLNNARKKTRWRCL